MCSEATGSHLHNRALTTMMPYLQGTLPNVCPEKYGIMVDRALLCRWILSTSAIHRTILIVSPTNCVARQILTTPIQQCPDPQCRKPSNKIDICTVRCKFGVPTNWKFLKKSTNFIVIMHFFLRGALPRTPPG